MTVYTKKQGQYLAFIHFYTKLNGVPPTEADMQAYFQAAAPSVHQMLERLEEKGLISKIPYAPRSIKILIPPDRIPELGKNVSGEMSMTGKSWSQASYIKAYRFAAEAHKGQLFPGTDLPYIMHISLVSMEIIACLDIESEHDGDLAVQCALLHDVIEDTEITYQEIDRVFGSKVAQGVLALTKSASLPKEQAMRDSLERIRQQPQEIWMVKMADRIANLGSPPHYWKRDKIEQYRIEAIEIHRSLHKASDYLSQRLMQKIDEYKMYLW
ncbi:MAG: HD domain-containing protein [Anaerolineales bacterium]|nr:HD domain-containing protein [Anaerolineales bacterium]